MKKTLPVIALALGLSGPVAAQTLSPVGVWANDPKVMTFEIYQCGNKLCGKVASIGEPNDPATGKPKTDTHNPDPKLRSRPLLGALFLQNLTYDANNKWDEGKIYDAESGKTYSCYVKMENATTLEMKGYVGFSLIGRSQTWTRLK